MTALSAVQPRSAAPGRPGRSAEGGGGEDFSAVLAAVGGAPSAQPTSTQPGSSAPQGEATRLPTPQVAPGAAAEPADPEPAVLPVTPAADAVAVPAPATARPAGLAPVVPALPQAAQPPHGIEPAPAPGAPGQPALAVVTAVQVTHEPARPSLPETALLETALPEADLPEALRPDVPLPDGEAPEQTAPQLPAPAAQAATAAPASDLPPVVAAPAPVAASATAAAAAAPAEAPPAPPPPAAQLLSGLAPVLEGPDGAHTMSLQLYPEELGAVQVEISLRNGEISLAMRTPDLGTLELLRSAAAELRTQLESAGLTSSGISVDLGHGDEKPTQQGTSGSATRSGDGQPADPADEPATTLSTSDSALDVRI